MTLKELMVKFYWKRGSYDIWRNIGLYSKKQYNSLVNENGKTTVEIEERAYKYVM